MYPSTSVFFPNFVNWACLNIATPQCLGRSVCADCSETTYRVWPQFWEQSSHSSDQDGPKSFLPDLGEDRKTHQGGRKEGGSMASPFDSESGER